MQLESIACKIINNKTQIQPDTLSATVGFGNNALTLADLGSKFIIRINSQGEQLDY